MKGRQVYRESDNRGRSGTGRCGWLVGEGRGRQTGHRLSLNSVKFRLMVLLWGPANAESGIKMSLIFLTKWYSQPVLPFGSVFSEVFLSGLHGILLGFCLTSSSWLGWFWLWVKDLFWVVWWLDSRSIDCFCWWDCGVRRGWWRLLVLVCSSKISRLSLETMFSCSLLRTW